MQRGLHLLHHAHHVAPTSCDLHTDAHSPTRDANAAVERTVSHFHRKFTLMAFALHTSRAAREKPPIAANYNLLAGAGVFAAFKRLDIPD